MLIDLTEILEELGNSATHKVTVPRPGKTLPDMPAGFNHPLTVQATLYNGGQSILAEVKLETTVDLQCYRCLAPVQEQLTAHYQEEYFAAEDRQEPLADDGDTRVALYYDQELDLTEGVRENLLLALPLRILCQADCRGLCATCGRDLNSGQCQCEAQEPVDPRLAVLAELLDDEKNS